jgi:hypothetical protein
MRAIYIEVYFSDWPCATSVWTTYTSFDQNLQWCGGDIGRQMKQQTWFHILDPFSCLQIWQDKVFPFDQEGC